jgi:tRNA dimethylallyltransferase
MDIGTAKATAEERAAVPHHLIDVVDPDEPYTLADYQETAYAAIEAIHARGGLPLLVGGTGLYVRAALDGFAIPRVPPNAAVRASLEAIAQKEGSQALHARLEAVDPRAAARIDHRNVRRVVRALEVFEVTGRRISEQQSGAAPPWRVLTVGLTAERTELYRRIDTRVDWQMENGLLDETEGLIARGYGCELPSMSSLGYRQICMYLRGELSLDAAVELIKTRTHRFARQQYTWFRLDDPSISWLQADSSAPERALALVEALVGSAAGRRRPL